MYRVVKFHHVKFRRCVTQSFQSHCNVCSLCGIKNGKLISNLKIVAASTNALITREHSTNTEVMFASELTKRKRFRSNKKFFTELLEVFNENVSSKSRMSELKHREVPCITISPNLKKSDFNKIMKNLKVNQNGIFTTGTEGTISLVDISEGKECNEINKLKSNNSSMTDLSEVFAREKVNSYNEPKETGNFVDDHENDSYKNEELQFSLNEPLTSLQETDLSEILNISSANAHFQESTVDEYEIQSEDVDSELVTGDMENLETKPLMKEKRKTRWHRTTKEKLAKENVSDLEKKLKEKAFNTILYTFLNLCVSCNFLQRSLFTLNFYISRSKKSAIHPKITDVRIFEVLIRGFAAKGNQHKVNELLKLMPTTGLKPSLDMFAARLECAARSPKNRHLVPGIISELKETGCNLNDLFVKCTFLGDQRNVILKAIQEVEKKFTPVVPPPSICYSCSLLQGINEDQAKSKEFNSPAEGLFTKDELRNFAEEQLKNELSFNLKVQSIERRIEPEGLLEVNRQKLDSMKKSWVNELKNGLDREIAILEMTKKPSTFTLLPYMRALDSESYIDIMMKEVQRLAEGSETFSPTTYQLYRNLGNQVRNRFVIKYKQTHGIADKTKMLYEKYCDWYLNPSINELSSSNGRQQWQQLIHKHQDGPSIIGEEDYWPATVLIGIGRLLYNIIVGDVKIDVNVLKKTSKQHMLPAFYRVYRQQGVKSVEEIKPHPVISKLYRAAGEQHIMFDIMHVPMLSPPLPWTSYQAGGYLTAKTDLMRLPDQALLQRKRLKDAPIQQLYPSLDSLNQLGSIPWIINKPVLDTVIEVFNNGGSAKLEIPEPPYLSPAAEPVSPDMSKEERYQAYRQRMVLRRQKAEMYSLWCDALYKLSLANHFRDRVFWLPHNMDFRGRVYPCPPHLNHLGADMSRSLMCFAKGKPLGPDGLDWLKMHLVNLIGTKKRDSEQDRLAYANSILPDILDSAENPLTGGKWWMESETPWQTLACCKEIYAALQHPDGPQHFSSHFPVHQDGSCNGLQHYAALGRDEAGASSVNLMPYDTPQDVYSCVAALVERERAKDSAAGVKVAQELDGFVRRKVIKQTVMTTVYGVTRFGARLQIAKQLKDIDSFPKEYVWPASTYLVVKTFESLREMFNSTREIQDWFTECARLVSHVCGENMEYVTPLGLPVVQHYSRQIKKIDIRVSKLGQLQEYFPIDMFDRPNVMKQKNAFPPNFIHSLDSSHMMLTSIFSEQRGITFVSVHDCYWTHACTVPIMNQICREQFVALHSQPILEELSEFMLKRYGHDKRERMDESAVSQAKQRLHNVLAQVPPKGKFILENVLDSIYFFS